MWRTPVIEASESSMGCTTCRVSSLGAAPGWLTVICTRGRSMFGIAVTASREKL